MLSPDSSFIRPLYLLCADSGRYKFKNSVGVIVKSANYSGIDLVVDIHCVKIFFHLAEMLSAIIAEVIEHYGRVLRDLLTDGAFAVENAHRISFKS